MLPVWQQLLGERLQLQQTLHYDFSLPILCSNNMPQFYWARIRDPDTSAAT